MNEFPGDGWTPFFEAVKVIEASLEMSREQSFVNFAVAKCNPLEPPTTSKTPALTLNRLLGG